MIHADEHVFERRTTSTNVMKKEFRSHFKTRTHVISLRPFAAWREEEEAVERNCSHISLKKDVIKRAKDILGNALALAPNPSFNIRG